MKKFACECGKLGVWDYAPSSNFWGFYCDDCVPRGCSCRIEYVKHESCPELNREPPKDAPWKWIQEGVSWELTDEKGRGYPCVEFWCEPEGVEVTEQSLSYYKEKGIEVRVIEV